MPQIEPAAYLPESSDPGAASGRGWGGRAQVIATLDQALTGDSYLLGERFTAADVMLGSLLSIARFNRRIPDPPAWLTSYDRRLASRGAHRAAAQATWPPASTT